MGRTKSGKIVSPPIEHRILLLRGQKVMLDADLAALYAVPTRALNQAVKRNRDRFPTDFVFRLSKDEKTEVVTNCDHLQMLKLSPVLPYAFTEHGAVMLASILNSRKAIQVSVYVVRALVKLREVLSLHPQVAKKLSELERTVASHDVRIQSLFDAIRQLMAAPSGRRRRIGFQA
jgi:hypothetical protein